MKNNEENVPKNESKSSKKIKKRQHTLGQRSGRFRRAYHREMYSGWSQQIPYFDGGSVSQHYCGRTETSYWNNQYNKHQFRNYYHQDENSSITIQSLLQASNNYCQYTTQIHENIQDFSKDLSQEMNINGYSKQIEGGKDVMVFSSSESTGVNKTPTPPSENQIKGKTIEGIRREPKPVAPNALSDSASTQKTGNGAAVSLTKEKLNQSKTLKSSEQQSKKNVVPGNQGISKRALKRQKKMNKMIANSTNNVEEKGEYNSEIQNSLKETKICLLCDTEGHSSFECQMICKNCSGRYHGYRTCPQPANLGTMMQIYMEFISHQFFHFDSWEANAGEQRKSQSLREWLNKFPGLNYTPAAATDTIQSKKMEANNSAPKTKAEAKKRRIGRSSNSVVQCKKICTRKGKAQAENIKSTKNTGTKRSVEQSHQPTSHSLSTANMNTSDVAKGSSKAAFTGKTDEVTSKNTNLSTAKETADVPQTLNPVQSTDVQKQTESNTQPQVTNSTVLNLLLGQLLQNALSGLKGTNST